jgi:hypothetical protein
LNQNSLKKNYRSTEEESTTTEKKSNIKNVKIELISSRPFYMSQETEKGAGGTNSYSTAAEEFQSIQKQPTVKSKVNEVVRKENLQLAPSKQQECLIKVT